MVTSAPSRRRRFVGSLGSITTDTIMIEAAPDVVWAVYTDIDRWPQWTASVTTAELAPGGPLAVGSRASIKQPRFPRVTWTVTSVEPERSWEWANRAPGARTSASHVLTSLDDGRTRVDLSIDQRGVIGRPIGWLVRRITRRYLRLEAEGLRRHSESHVGQALSARPRSPRPE